jgi:hypothetical protein
MEPRTSADAPDAGKWREQRRAVDDDVDVQMGHGLSPGSIPAIYRDDESSDVRKHTADRIWHFRCFFA